MGYRHLKIPYRIFTLTPLIVQIKSRKIVFIQYYLSIYYVQIK